MTEVHIKKQILFTFTVKAPVFLWCVSLTLLGFEITLLHCKQALNQFVGCETRLLQLVRFSFLSHSFLPSLRQEGMKNRIFSTCRLDPEPALQKA